MNEELEILIDAHGLETLLAALSDICYRKADHVQTNWQDAKLARQWTKRAGILHTASIKVENLPIA